MLLLNYAHSMQNSMGDIWISASHIQGPINQCYQQMNYVGKLHSMKSGNEDRLSWRRQLWQAVIVNIALLVQGEQGRKKQKKKSRQQWGAARGRCRTLLYHLLPFGPCDSFAFPGSQSFHVLFFCQFTLFCFQPVLLLLLLVCLFLVTIACAM